ncbi:gag/pol/env polyprotein, putative [Perkinsus marinus ATCC 50983]|uniref:Gag/pol/env polyprotein, putative n=1 Tax=Perkinsus marinus (strain ATCC 50983 / TXsc) TaxID=423536 RepID=C5LVX7_PERM5|nr:gag/pol/env polyprotein, putative [Perkinsus marinus ATCC 50983]EEQ99128.1 gag/pol/env polyprotein, putative [Perkinsus marinus ATCC 50983]|eukprot:XP_002766411.1 gag/pol/env polyprotein, putative [Perkinsus marinus ATCC 50983]
MPNLNPSALIGRPGICDLALSVHGFVPTQTASEVAVCSIDPVETIEVAGKGKRLLAHCPRLEESRPELHVEPQRRRPDRERKAIYRLLCLMEKEEKVVRLQPGQAWTINEVVLVAKKGAESWKCLPGILDREDDEQLLAHFRVTLDLRFTNKIGATTPTLETENESKLSQYGVHDLIGSLPSHHGAFFGRIDLRDAFHGVYISKKMQQHMATRVLNDQGVEVIFAWNRLPMGYKQSSGLFGRSVELMLIEAREALRKLNIDCSLRSLQDDCIVAGPTASAVNEALDVLIRVVRSYGFECRNSKVQRATDHLVFCGHQISGRESGLPLLTPCPQRRDLSSAGFEAEWEIFIKKCKSSSAKLKFLRKWAGVFQWFSHWLGGLEQDALRCLNKAVKCLQNNDAVDDEQWEKVSVAWHTLAQSFMSGLASLYLGHCIATLIVTDSNVESWYGAILGVVTLDSDNACPALFPELEERLYDISPCDDLFPMPPTGKIFRVLPVRLCGGVWKKREQLRSSTWRERGAQLQCVSENLDALRGDHVISLNDNANLCKTWRDVQGDFGYASEPYAGVWIKRWELFEAYVDKCVWLPREVDALCWTDMSARKLAAGDSADGMIGEVEIAPVDVNNSSGQLNVDDMTKEEVNDIYGCSVVSDDKMHSILVTFSGQPSYEDALSWLSSKQKEDEQLAKIRVSCEKEHKESREFLVEKDCLFHLGRWRADEPVIKQAVLPDCGGLRSTILGEFHEYGIHGSAQLLSGMVQQAYWWPTLRKDCKVFVRKCEVCQRSTKCASDICISRSGQRLQVPLPWYSVGSDVFMLGRELEAEFNLHWTAMLTITCAFTGFTVLVPLPQPVDSACIINAYLYAFSLYGYPRHLRCDGGANLVSQDVNSWLLAHGVSSTVAVGYSPWTGGYYERRHRDLAATLRKFLLDLKYGTGAMYVNSPYALAAMLQGQLNSYGIDWRGARDTTSQMLMTGTIPRPPASLDDIAPRDNWSSQGIFGEINLKEASGEDVALREAKLVEVLRKRATDIRKRRDECLRDFNTVWLERREEARNRFDQTLARKQTKELLKIGDKVLLAERFPSKFAPRWSKPREVVALRGLRCIVKNDDGTLRELHLRYVKKFHSGEEVQPVTTSKRDRPDDIEDHEDGDQGEVQQDDKSPATSSAVRTRPVRKCSRMTSYAHQL